MRFPASQKDWPLTPQLIHNLFPVLPVSHFFHPIENLSLQPILDAMMGQPEFSGHLLGPQLDLDRPSPLSLLGCWLGMDHVWLHLGQPICPFGSTGAFPDHLSPLVTWRQKNSTN